MGKNHQGHTLVPCPLKTPTSPSSTLLVTMSRTYTLLFVILTIVHKYAQAASMLPPYIKACKVGPKLDECAIRNGQAALPFLAKGDPRLRIPPMDPLLITKLEVTDSKSKSIAMNITMENIKAYGILQGKIISARNNLANKTLSWTIAVPKLVLLCDYKISGRFLVLPIIGNGPANITLENAMFNYVMSYKLEKRKGEEYSVPISSDLKYATKQLYIKLDNLFNGDKALGKQMNDFMNANWKELNDAVGPSLAYAVSIYFMNVFNNIFKMVPFNQVFLP